MRVSHQEDHVTHAVVSGNKTQDMGISSSAEFFHILSSTLYRNQRLAVIREVICNAWDAHIMVGRLHLPVRITLDSDQLVIQDFGPGISPEDFGPIYGVYGHSTKKNDGEQTGGFGLGCKSPFAYTDHFEVTSCYAGTKTIYALSKSSAEAMGKPGITPIVSVPTEEHGITVKINVKTGSDFGVFRQYIHEVVRNGEIFATLNEKPIETLKFADAEKNFIFVDEMINEDSERLNLRYGNVIYPIPNNSAYSHLYNQVREYTNNVRPVLILMAPPHSISVTPSREALSMQDKTINTIKQMLTDFINEMVVNQDERQKALIPEVIQHVIDSGEVKSLLDARKIRDHAPVKHGVLNNVHDVTMEFWRSYDGHMSEREAMRDMHIRLTTYAKAHPEHRGRVFSLLALGYKKVARYHRWRHCEGVNHESNWIQRHLLRSLSRKIDATQGMSTERLRMHHTQTWQADSVFKFKDIPQQTLKTCAQMINAKIFLSTSLMSLRNHVQRNDDRYFSYICQNQPNHIEAARKLLADSGFEVIDLIVEQAKVKAAAGPKAPKIKKIQGLPKLSYAFDTSNDFVPRQYLRGVKNKMRMDLLEEPKYIAQIQQSGTYNRDNIDGLSESTHLIGKLFAGETGVSSNSRQSESYERKGSIPIRRAIRDFFIKELSYHSQIRRAFSISPLDSTKVEADAVTSVCNAALKFSRIQKELNLGYILTGHEETMMQILRTNWDRIKHDDDMIILRDRLRAVEIHPTYLTALKNLERYEAASLFNASRVELNARNNRHPTPSSLAMEDLLMYIITK